MESAEPAILSVTVARGLFKAYDRFYKIEHVSDTSLLINVSNRTGPR